MAGGKASSSKAKLIERRQKALHFRKAGVSYMLDIIQRNSNGLINDRAPHAPTVVITECG
jgi:hypothetical protein